MLQNTQKNPDSLNHDGKTSFKTIAGFFLKIIIAAAIVAFLVHKSGNIEGLSSLKISELNIGWIAVACFFYAVHLFVNAWRWRLLLKYRSLPCSLFEACSLTAQSFFFSLVMPGGAIGGDVIRAGFLSARFPKGAKFEGVFTILMDRFTGMIGIFLMAFIFLPFALPCFSGGNRLDRLFLLVLFLGSAAGLAAALFVFGHRYLEKIALFRRLEDIGERLTHGFSKQLLDTLDAYSGAKLEIFICVLASIVGVNFVLGICFYCVCLACDANVFAPLFLPIVTAITMGNIAGLIPATPSGIGMRDYFVNMIIAAALANSAAEYAPGALVPTLLMTLVIIGMSLLGGIFFLFDRTGKKKDEHGAEYGRTTRC